MAVFSEKFPPLTAFLVPPYLDDETPKKRPTLYEDLRSRNRENYEVTLTQKADILLKSPAETPVLKRGGDSFPTEICCYWDYLLCCLEWGCGYSVSTVLTYSTWTSVSLARAEGLFQGTC